MSADDLDPLQETQAILRDPEAMRALAEAERDIAEGNLSTPEEVAAALEARRK